MVFRKNGIGPLLSSAIRAGENPSILKSIREWSTPICTPVIHPPKSLRATVLRTSKEVWCRMSAIRRSRLRISFAG